jgi:hypothetical protein
VLAVVLGFRTLRKAKAKRGAKIVIEEIVIESGEEPLP